MTPHLDIIRSAFERHFGPSEATTIVTAPGRVNLMGDHVDYNGLPVLPMALQRHVSLLFRARDDATVHFTSTNPSYPPRTFDLGSTIEPYAEGDWGNYAKAVVQAFVRSFGIERGFDAIIHSDIPVASGLSSSSALVVAHGLALLHVNAVHVEPLELAERTAQAENYVGTRGGGMDQAICLAARRQTASRIDFHPLRVKVLPVPADWRFVVAFSLVRAEKSGKVREDYNAGPRECKEALLEMTRDLDVAADIETYPELMAHWDTTRLLKEAARVLNEKHLRRFRHVVTEGDRVSRAEQAMVSADLETFGRLMCESHESLRGDFGVSTPALDELVAIAMDAGAFGARLTGAGLGGCVVALAAREHTDQLLQTLADRYYSKRQFEGTLEDQLFVAEPSAGAQVTPLVGSEEA
jgi:galactokinase